MSLALVQDYTSDEENQDKISIESDSSSTGEDENGVKNEEIRSTQRFENPESADLSILPSPTDVFSEITGPPEYLKATTEPMPYWKLNSSQCIENVSWPSQRRLNKLQAIEERSGRNLPSGAIVEAKAQLVEVYEHMSGEKVDSAKQNSLRVPTVGLPPPEDAAQLLRTCLQCGVPKTYSGSKERMVCPLCNDHVRADELVKKRGSNIKEKERSKRMKGQSSHATWKSETEMHLRQQFD